MEQRAAMTDEQRNAMHGALRRFVWMSLLTVICGGAWWLLDALGDDAGATAARWSTALFGLLWWLNFVAMVLILALQRMAQSAPDSAATRSPPTPR